MILFFVHLTFTIKVGRRKLERERLRLIFMQTHDYFFQCNLGRYLEQFFRNRIYVRFV